MDNICSIDISETTFKEMNSKDRDAVIFDCLKTLSRDVQTLKTREKADKKELMWIGGVFGFLGGLIVTALKFILPF